jgi:tellurite resistance protein TerB
MLAAMKEKLASAMAKVNGRQDFLEAVCAASALVASADGEVSDDEIKNTIKVVTANPRLTKSFKQGAIEKCIDTMLKRAASGRTGRAGLYKEIEDVRGDTAISELVYLAAVDIAETDGNIADKEQSVLTLIAGKLNVSPNVANV